MLTATRLGAAVWPFWSSISSWLFRLHRLRPRNAACLYYQNPERI